MLPCLEERRELEILCAIAVGAARNSVWGNLRLSVHQVWQNENRGKNRVLASRETQVT